MIPLRPSTCDDDGDAVIIGQRGTTWSNEIFAQRLNINPHDGGGLYADSGATVNVNNSIVAGNHAANRDADVAGAFVSLGTQSDRATRISHRFRGWRQWRSGGQQQCTAGSEAGAAGRSRRVDEDASASAGFTGD